LDEVLTRFCERLPTGYEIPLWERWPGAGVGICCGFGDLVALDIDTDDHDLTAAILRELPESPVQKRGAKGRTLFFRGEVESRPFDVNGQRVLDVLSGGKFCVVPPTIHPSGQSYQWLTAETLISTPLEGLPRLPDDTAEGIAAALAPFGYVPEPERPHRASTGGSWHALKAAALANLDLWVPALNLPKTHRSGQGWRAVAAWRGVENPNLSFNPAGIRDFASGQPFSAIDVVMNALGISPQPPLGSESESTHSPTKQNG
jgi:hypothetical protein